MAPQPTSKRMCLLSWNYKALLWLFRWMSFAAKIKSLNLIFQHNLWHQSITHRVELCFPNGGSVDTELNIHFDCTVSYVGASVAVLFSVFKCFTGQWEACGDWGWACCSNGFIGRFKSYLSKSSLLPEKEGERNSILAPQYLVSSLDSAGVTGPVRFDGLFVTIKCK